MRRQWATETGPQGGRRYVSYADAVERMTREDRLRAALLTEASRLRLTASRACNPIGNAPAGTLATMESIAEELRRAVAKFKGGDEK